MDSKLYNLIYQEIERQRWTINLIPSENLASPKLLKILGSPLVNKYSEGYPGKRYYPGNKIYDEIEELARRRALKTFGLSSRDWAVNVQSYSGSPANHAVYSALINPGETLMGLSLTHGGHLTHGHLVNFSGQMYQSLPYELDLKTGRIDYKYLEKLAREHNPKIIISGATAYPRKIDFKRIKEIARRIKAYTMADISHIAGLVVAGLHPNPFRFVDVVTTTTHKSLRGPRGALIFSRKKTTRNGKSITELIDRAVFPGLQGGPHNNQTAAIAFAMREAKTKEFKEYQIQVVRNAFVLANELIKLGFKLISGGTDNHLMLVDLSRKKITGMDAEKKLEDSGIVANRNSIPGDKKPFRPSGIRIGTPYITSRGMKDKEMKIIAKLIYKVLVEKKNQKQETQKLCMQFPLPY